MLTLITGVAGSGKSSLINEAFLRQHLDAIVIDTVIVIEHNMDVVRQADWVIGLQPQVPA